MYKFYKSLLVSFNRPCIQIGILGLMFGLISVSYAQDGIGSLPLEQLVTQPGVMTDVNLIDLLRTLGWPASFAYMLYRTAEKVLSGYAEDMDAIRETMQNAHKEIKIIRRHIVKEVPDDLDV